MAQTFPYTFTCEKCGGTFYSKVDPSSWKHKVCNACSGKQYKDYPVEGSQPAYVPKPVPVKPTYNNVPVRPVEKKEFNLEDYIADMLITYQTIKNMCDDAKLTVPEDSICSWTTSIMIQKGKLGG